MSDQVCETSVQIKNEEGLHMRPAMQFVDLANRYQSTLTVSDGKQSVDGKSIMQMSMLAAICGTTLQLRAEGKDAQEAIKALQELVEVRVFDEG